MNIRFENYNDNYLNEIVQLWNNNASKDGIFKEWTKESITKKMLNSPLFEKDGFKLMFDDDKLIGMGDAVCNDARWGYINFIVIDKPYQRKGLGKMMLDVLEGYCKQKGEKKIRLYFGSPFNFEWYIPAEDVKDDFKRHIHPGAPAIEQNSPYYFLLVNNGYTIEGAIDAFHANITNYELPEKVLLSKARNEKDGYTIEIYDEAKHHGFSELFSALNNPGWYQAVKNNLAKEKPEPMLVVQKEGRILGWTGPMHTDETGRAYFAGIGVHPEVQGRGLGKQLFSELAYYSKKNKATYMSLFTGADNLARNIYLYTGLKIVKAFFIMGKELK